MEQGSGNARSAPDARMVDRMLFFSDAVFAIVLTLLVLELRVPIVEGDAALAEALRGLTAKFVAFAASFALVSVFWAAHMTITRRLVAFDWPVAWLNLIFLFTIAVMPFVSALIGEYGTFGLAWRIYCATLVAASLAQSLLVLALTGDGGKLVGGITGREIAWRLSRALSPGIAFGIGLWLSYNGEPRLSALCWIIIPIVMIFARLILSPGGGGKTPDA